MGNYQGKHYKKYKNDIKILSMYDKITNKLANIINTYDNFIDNLDNKVRGQVLKVGKKMQSRERNVCGVNTAQDKCKSSTWSVNRSRRFVCGLVINQ